MQQNIHGGDIYSRQIRLDFSVNGNPLGMPDAAVQAIHEAVQHVGEYPDITAAALTEAVSRMLSGECWQRNPKGVSAVWQRGIRTFSGGCACT